MYKVLDKSAQGKKVIEDMVAWISTNHLGESGIIYCFKKSVRFLDLALAPLRYLIPYSHGVHGLELNILQETKDVAEKIHNVSGGKITTGVYHADVPDEEKERLHERWRQGKIKVVCATIGTYLGTESRLQVHADDWQRSASASTRRTSDLSYTTPCVTLLTSPHAYVLTSRQMSVSDNASMVPRLFLTPALAEIGRELLSRVWTRRARRPRRGLRALLPRTRRVRLRRHHQGPRQRRKRSRTSTTRRAHR